GAQKNAILFAAFGKSGQAMIPILEKGSAALKNLSAATALVFTQEQLEQARQYEIEINRLGQQFDDLKARLGANIVPALLKTAQTLNDNADAMRILRAEAESGQISWHDYSAIVRGAGDANLSLLDAARKAAAGAREQGAAAREAA